MNTKEIINKLILTIDENKEEIISIGEQVLQNPETGYCEKSTSQLIQNAFSSIGLDFEYPLALTGVKATLGKKQNKPNICIIGEMDALKCSGHKNANSDGVAHACGHHAQIAAMLGAAIGLCKSGITDKLDGNVTFLAVPAEEFIELGYRKSLKEQGKISYYGGKQQLIADGVFDDIDIAIMLHAQPNEPEAKVYVRGHNLGFMSKTITLRGKSAHGSTPYDGTNALNAAALAILGIHSNRETFRDEDKIRIHPIITKGGEVVNSVPDEVCIETYVRGASLEAIKKGNEAVERSVFGAAQIVGATAEIENIPGYLPLCESTGLSEVFEDVCKYILQDNALVYGEPITGSSDIGDLSSIIPVIQPSIGGFTGNLHSTDFSVVNKDTAYILSAKLLAAAVIELLSNNGEKAKSIIENHKPVMTKEQYINYLKGE